MRSDKAEAKAVNSPQANKERTVHVHMSVENLCILRKNSFDNCSSGSGLLLIFHDRLPPHYFLAAHT